MGQDSTVTIATHYRLGGLGDQICGGKIFCSCPDQPRGLYSLLYNFLAFCIVPDLVWRSDWCIIFKCFMFVVSNLQLCCGCFKSWRLKIFQKINLDQTVECTTVIWTRLLECTTVFGPLLKSTTVIWTTKGELMICEQFCEVSVLTLLFCIPSTEMRIIGTSKQCQYFPDITLLFGRLMMVNSKSSNWWGCCVASLQACSICPRWTTSTGI
jgi:hypothetical protein